MGTFHVEIAVGDPEGHQYETVQALVDTGATYTMVPSSMLRRLGVQPHTHAVFHLADGRGIERDIGQTWVRVNGGAVITLIVFGDEDAQPLLGSYTMEGLLLAPDPVNERLVSVPGLLM